MALPTTINASQCMKCGFCMSVCPVYQADHVESHVARGRNLLIRMAEAGTVPDPDAYGDCLDFCLLCGRCQTVCPAGVPSPAINVQARSRQMADHGASLGQKLLFKGLLKHRSRMARLMGIAARIPGVSHTNGRPLRHMADALTLFSGGMSIPRISKPFLSGRIERCLRPPGGTPATDRVAFFAGCGFEFFFAQAGADTARALARAGVDVITPEGLTCCGMAVHNAGDWETARAMARRNIDILASYDRIVTGCATCGSTLKHYGQWFENDAAMGERARAFSAKVMDFSEFLVAREAPVNHRNNTPVTVTYHDPCHLKWHQGISDFPRKVLDSLTDVELVEMENADACCGLGGTFGVKHRQTSLSIQAKKMESIQKTGASKVVTACPGCMIQLMDGVRRFGLDVEVVHLAQLLSEPQ
ncbi:(Fe-S)-binding protein [Desulfosarcina ovata]|uniref:Glycolate oxidase iron-sulfur subunit n=1 Tax=Desulfosarcina ovata subsp. ovata TaxID=2752305 RepID=A0A5K8ADQ3_9BACT|nr:(Fe-S)-binding protein [Desulfosarcina ovata]BBO90707.1 glycolate oxidase iron-sulfur subunit [Desulfosarcina ovata subsp. ovata]